MVSLRVLDERLLGWRMWLLLVSACGFLLAPQCAAPNHVHVRRHLAWCLSSPDVLWASGKRKGKKGNGTQAKKTRARAPQRESIWRLEAEVAKWNDEGPTLRLHWVNVQTQRRMSLPAHVSESLQVRVKDWAKTERSILGRLLSPDFVRHYRQQCGELVKKSLLGGVGTPWFRARRAQKQSQALLRLSRALPLSDVDKVFRPFRVMFRALEADGQRKDVLSVALVGTPHRWPVAERIPWPKKARLQHMDCSPAQCILEFDYAFGEPTRPVRRFTYLATFRPRWVAARLYHLRGYRQHDKKAYRRAANDFQRAVKLDPRYLDAHYNLACACALTKQYQRAAQLLRMLFSARSTYLPLACKDTDFKHMRTLKQFRRLFRCTSASPSASSRPVPSRRRL
jgi:hypothetical protein